MKIYNTMKNKTWSLLRLAYCAIGALLVGMFNSNVLVWRYESYPPNHVWVSHPMHPVTVWGSIAATLLIVASVVWGLVENKGREMESAALKIVILLAGLMIMHEGFLGIFHNWTSWVGILLLLMPFAYRIYYAK